MKYVIYYDYTDYAGYEYLNGSDYFTGTHSELQDLIKTMREEGYYNITAVGLDEE